MPYKMIVYDFDNTLVETNEFIRDNIIETLGFIDIEKPSLDKIVSVLRQGIGFEDIFTHLFGEKGSFVLAKYRELAKNKSFEPKPGVVDFVHKINKMGIAQAIVTNRLKMLDERLSQAGFENVFALKIQPSEGIRKPDPKIYDAVLKFAEDNGIKKDEIVSIGDQLDDYKAAHDAGIDFRAVIAYASSEKDDFLINGLENKKVISDFRILEDELNG